MYVNGSDNVNVNEDPPKKIDVNVSGFASESTSESSRVNEIKSILEMDVKSKGYNEFIYDSLQFSNGASLLETSETYIGEIARAVIDEDFFNNFKSKKVAPRIYTVFFAYFESFANMKNLAPADL
jgi:hypothetical protein